MSWLYLVFAGLFEIVWAYGLKQSDGFTKLVPSVYTLVFMALSFGLLSLALKQLPIGTAYAVWTGIGAVGTAIMGMVFLGEARDLPKIVCVFLIGAGIAGLKFAS